MSNPQIALIELGKRYRVAHQRAGYRTLRESLMERLAHPWQREAKEEFWALREVTFDVPSGDVLGVIGRNGAGKSTLLKILSRITAPTKGQAVLRGRVGSLLEIGAGFHPELTGCENVFLSGAILGMTRREIRQAFDEIVAFAEIERFLDTPVKRYSSGMYVRLAFAVAAHLQTDILIVDEVLAVGDVSFQRKCLGRMGDAARSGRTVLVVSHNMSAIRGLCRRALWLDAGRVRALGPADEVVTEYLSDATPLAELAQLAERIAELAPDPVWRWQAVRIMQQGRPTLEVVNHLPVEIELEYEVREAVHGLRVVIDLLDESSDLLIRSFHDERAEQLSVLAPGRYRSRVVVPADLLAPRAYRLSFRATIHNVRDIFPDALSATLHAVHSGEQNRAYPDDPIRGKFLSPLTWTTERQ